jgi:type II secretory pathway pseudopilin PulG
LTLVEVMLALGIMLIALVAIAHLIQVGSEAGYDARMNARAGRLAQGKMAEVESGVMPVQNGGGSGTYSGDDAGWSWAVDLEPQGPANTYLATVKITRTLRGKPFTFSLAQMIVDPAMMGSAAQAEQPTTDDTTAATTLSGVGGTGGVNGTGATTP